MITASLKHLQLHLCKTHSHGYVCVCVCIRRACSPAGWQHRPKVVFQLCFIAIRYKLAVLLRKTQACQQQSCCFTATMATPRHQCTNNTVQLYGHYPRCNCLIFCWERHLQCNVRMQIDSFLQPQFPKIGTLNHKLNNCNSFCHILNLKQYTYNMKPTHVKCHNFCCESEPKKKYIYIDLKKTCFPKWTVLFFLYFSPHHCGIFWVRVVFQNWIS